MGRLGIEKIHELADEVPRVPVLSAVPVPWVVNTRSGFDLISVEKVRGMRLRALQLFG